MTEATSCVERDALVDYLYGEADAEARRRVDTHLRSCATCAEEIRSLKEVRGSLQAWVAPEPRPGVDVGSAIGPRAPVWGRPRRAWRRPVWGVAAAVLVLASAAVMSRSEIEVLPDRTVIRIGWRRPAAEVIADAVPRRPEPVSLGDAQTLLGTPVASGSRGLGRPQPGAELGQEPGGGDDAWLQRVLELIRESEQRQARALSDRVAQVEQRIEARRRADLSEMERTFREVDPDGAEVTSQQLLEYVRRISDRRSGPGGR